MARANQRRRRTGEVTRAISPPMHNYLGYIAQAAQEYEALLPLMDRDRQPYQYAALLGNTGLHADRPRRFRSGACVAHARRSSCTRRSAKKKNAPSSWPRSADCTSAWAMPNARSKRCAPPSLNRNGSRDTVGLASTLRVAANAASVLGQHDAALDYLRKSARIDANPHTRRAHARADRARSCARSAISRPPRRELAAHPGIQERAGSCSPRSRSARACALAQKKRRVGDRRPARGRSAVRGARTGVQSHRYQHRAVAGAARHARRARAPPRQPTKRYRSSAGSA